MDRPVCKRNRCKENKTVVNQPDKRLPLSAQFTKAIDMADGNNVS